MIYCNGKESTPKLNGVDLSRVMYNGKQIWPSLNNVVEIQLANTIAGDICVYDGSNKRFFRFTDSGATDNITNYTPIGVVVIPASHNVYGDGSCGVMSLKEMNRESPDSGSTSYQSILWGGYRDDISLPNLNQVPTGNTSDGIPTGSDSSGHLPSDNFSGTQCAHDTDTYYDSSSYMPYIPSPYLTDGSRNPGYYQTTSPSSSRNALADFDGIGNSQVLWDLATSQSSWKTASSISNISGSGYYPAACCCWRYHTEGTQQGDWYLPACGELGYIIPSFNKIKDAIEKMRTAYGSSVGVKLSARNNYWSSTEYSGVWPRNIYMGQGSVSVSAKNTSTNVRAFLKVSPSDLSGTSTVSLSCDHCTFEDGSTSKNEIVQTGSTYTLPTVIRDEGYVFGRWYKDGVSFSSSQNAQALIEADCYFQAACFYAQPPAPDE